jgi:hypothetical protein
MQYRCTIKRLSLQNKMHLQMLHREFSASIVQSVLVYRETSLNITAIYGSELESCNLGVSDTRPSCEIRGNEILRKCTIMYKNAKYLEKCTEMH